MNTINSLQIKNKMLSIKRMAVFFSHKLNNILATMTYSAQLANTDIDQNSQAAQDLKRIIESGLQGSELLYKNSFYFNPGKTGQKLINLTDFFSSKIEAVNKKNIINNTKPIIFKSFEDELYVKADPAHLEIVIDELISNAIIATENTDPEIKVTISKKDKIFTDIFIVYHSQEFVTISVTDNGCGITEDVIHDIFDPFFTTGDPNKRLGVGLTKVYGLVESHNGEIAVISMPGMTLFNVYLPIDR